MIRWIILIFDQLFTGSKKLIIFRDNMRQHEENSYEHIKVAPFLFIN